MSRLIESLEWRYATKKFDASKRITLQDFELIKKAINLSASSYGLQPFKVLNIENQELREELVQYAWNQRQVADASHLLVFCSYLKMEEDNIKAFNQFYAKKRGLKAEHAEGRSQFIIGKLRESPSEKITHWAAKQAYIALGNVMTVCADMQIDTCPMEGFEVAAFDELLGLKDQNLTTTLLLPIGYRSAEDLTQHAVKVRREDLFVTV